MNPCDVFRTFIRGTAWVNVILKSRLFHEPLPIHMTSATW